MAPNPYWEHCTLAICKPQIRKLARDGDWVVGLSPKARGHTFVFAMKVSEILTFGEYFEDKRFEIKKPRLDAEDPRFRVGDNFYQPLGNNLYKQLPSIHSNVDGTENLKKKERDLSGRHALIAREFYYSGDSGDKIPNNLEFLIVGRGYKNQFSQKEIVRFLRYVERFSLGISGNPKDLDRTLKLIPTSLSLFLSHRT